MKTRKLGNRTLVVIAGISIALLSSCSKERIEQDSDLNKFESMNEYFDSKKQEEQDFVIDTAGTEPIIGKEGTKIWPSKEKLMFANGDSVQWPYTVKLVELYPAKEMVYYQVMNETSSNGFFSCKAEVRVRAFKDGQELVLRPGESWGVELSDPLSSSNINIYYESESTNTVTWNKSTEEFIDSQDGYLGAIAPLGWVAGGITAGGEEPTTISLTSEVDDLTTVRSYIYLTNLESVIEISNQKSISVPVGEDAQVFCLAMDKNKNLYYYYNAITIQDDMTLNVTMQEISDEALTVILNEL